MDRGGDVGDACLLHLVYQPVGHLAGLASIVAYQNSISIVLPEANIGQAHPNFTGPLARCPLPRNLVTEGAGGVRK